MLIDTQIQFLRINFIQYAKIKSMKLYIVVRKSEW